MKLDERIHRRAIALVKKGDAVISTHRPNPPGVFAFATLNTQKYINWRSQSLAFLTDLLGPEHTYTSSFEKETEGLGHKEGVFAGIGVLQAVLEDIEQDFITTVRHLITAEVFADLFDQAAHLSESGYRAPAASLAGAVLENGLRTISTDRGVSLTAKDNLSSLNQKLAQKGIYTRLTQKKIHVWTDIRNAADHGRFDQITDQDVDDLIKGAQTLLSDYL